MNLFQFLNYIIFNKDNQRTTVWTEFKQHLSNAQKNRWAPLKERCSK